MLRWSESSATCDVFESYFQVSSDWVRIFEGPDQKT